MSAFTARIGNSPYPVKAASMVGLRPIQIQRAETARFGGLGLKHRSRLALPPEGTLCVVCDQARAAPWPFSAPTPGCLSGGVGPRFAGMATLFTANRR